MSDRRIRGMLFLLVLAIVLSAAGLALKLGWERLCAARASAARLEEQIRELHQALPRQEQLAAQRDALREDVQHRAARFYSPEEIDPYAFGVAVRERLAARGIAVQRYQTVDVGGRSYLEFSASGSARALVLFLRDVSQAAKLWAIPSLTVTVRAPGGTVDIFFRIGHAICAAPSG
jgi:hypothetical protein